MATWTLSRGVGDWLRCGVEAFRWLVPLPVFKTGVARDPGQAGSIPVRLRKPPVTALLAPLTCCCEGQWGSAPMYWSTATICACQGAVGGSRHGSRAATGPTSGGRGVLGGGDGSPRSTWGRSWHRRSMYLRSVTRHCRRPQGVAAWSCRPVSNGAGKAIVTAYLVAVGRLRLGLGCDLQAGYRA